MTGCGLGERVVTMLSAPAFIAALLLALARDIERLGQDNQARRPGLPSLIATVLNQHLPI